jgi:hypothetical protein
MTTNYDSHDIGMDIYNILESIDANLDRIANVMEMNHERALEREAVLAERIKAQEEREAAEALQRWRETYPADVGATAHPPVLHEPPF